MESVAPPQPLYVLPEAEVAELADYILHREKALDHTLLPYGDPAGKDVLVFGCGYGCEVLWAARHGARSVLALDISPGLSAVPFERALEREQVAFDAYEFRIQDVHDTAVLGQRYDLIVSNGVFEHILDLKGVLTAFRLLLRPSGRVAIFADALWYSSIGGHMGKEPWDHLVLDHPQLHRDLNENRWHVFRNSLNRMTAVDFLEALRSVGMIVLQLRLGRDPNLGQLPQRLPRIREAVAVSPTDLSVVSIGCELCFPENL